MSNPHQKLLATLHPSFATGVPHTPNYGFQGVPFLGDGRLGPSAMFVSPFLQGQMMQRGFTPLGFGHDQNTYDLLRKQQYTVEQQKTISDASQMDQESYMMTMRTMASAAGLGFGADQRRAARRVLDKVQMAAPMLAAMNPEILDQMGGIRGSATVMASRLVDHARYRFDPVTGKFGMGGDSAGAMSKEMFQQLYLDNSAKGMSGVTAGQAGSMFSEMQNRGMLGSDAAPGMDRRARIVDAFKQVMTEDPGAITKIAGTLRSKGVDFGKMNLSSMSLKDIDTLAMDDGIASKMRSMDTKKVAASIKEMSGAVAAMKEIFGDMGRPNAPMRELMAGLESMSMGGLSQFGPQRVAGIVRNTYNIAKSTGLSVDAAMTIQQDAAMRAQSMGLGTMDAIQATHGSMAFGGAFRAMGQGAGGVGSVGAEQAMQMDAQLRLQASGSNNANAQGLLLRMESEMGGFEKGSEASKLATRIKAGGLSVNQSPDEILRILGQANGTKGQVLGLSDGYLQSQLSDQIRNQEAAAGTPVQSNVRLAQAREYRESVADNLLLSFRSDATRGLSDDEIDKLDKEGVFGKAATNINGIDTARMGNTVQRPAAMAAAMRKALESSDTGRDILKKTGSVADQEAFLARVGSMQVGRMGQTARDGGFPSLVAAHQMMNSDTMNAGVLIEQKSEQTGKLQEAMSSVHAIPALANLMTTLQQLGTKVNKENINQVTFGAIGGVSSSKMNDVLKNQALRLNEERAAVDKLQAEFNDETDPDKRAKQQGVILDKLAGLKAMADSTSSLAQSRGLLQGTPGMDSIGRISKSEAILAEQENRIGMLRTGTQKDISGSRLREYATQVNKQDASTDRGKEIIADTRAMLRARGLPADGNDESVLQLAKNAATLVAGDFESNSPGDLHIDARKTMRELVGQHRKRFNPAVTGEQIEELRAIANNDQSLRAKDTTNFDHHRNAMLAEGVIDAKGVINAEKMVQYRSNYNLRIGADFSAEERNAAEAQLYKDKNKGVKDENAKQVTRGELSEYMLRLKLKPGVTPDDLVSARDRRKDLRDKDDATVKAEILKERASLGAANVRGYIKADDKIFEDSVREVTDEMRNLQEALGSSPEFGGNELQSMYLARDVGKTQDSFEALARREAVGGTVGNLLSGNLKTTDPERRKEITARSIALREQMIDQHAKAGSLATVRDGQQLSADQTIGYAAAMKSMAFNGTPEEKAMAEKLMKTVKDGIRNNNPAGDVDVDKFFGKMNDAEIKAALSGKGVDVDDATGSLDKQRRKMSATEQTLFHLGKDILPGETVQDAVTRLKATEKGKDFSKDFDERVLDFVERNRVEMEQRNKDNLQPLEVDARELRELKDGLKAQLREVELPFDDAGVLAFLNKSGETMKKGKFTDDPRQREELLVSGNKLVTKANYMHGMNHPGASVGRMDDPDNPFKDDNLGVSRAIADADLNAKILKKRMEEESSKQHRSPRDLLKDLVSAHGYSVDNPQVKDAIDKRPVSEADEASLRSVTGEITTAGQGGKDALAGVEKRIAELSDPTRGLPSDNTTADLKLLHEARAKLQGAAGSATGTHADMKRIQLLNKDKALSQLVRETDVNLDAPLKAIDSLEKDKTYNDGTRSATDAIEKSLPNSKSNSTTRGEMVLSGTLKIDLFNMTAGFDKTSGITHTPSAP